MPSILIAGYYGAGNIGDEAILSGMLSDLRGRHDNLEVTVLSWDPPQTSEMHAVRAVPWRDISGILDAAVEADLFIVGGGGIFQDHWGLDAESFLRRHHGGISTYASLPLLASLLGIPCMLYGVGVGPLEGEVAREHTLKAVERCQVVTVRDQSSLELLKEIGCEQKRPERTRLRLSADPAFSLPAGMSRDNREQLYHQVGIDGSGPLLAVSLRYWDQPSPPEDWLPDLADGINAFTEERTDLEILLIPFQINHDSAYTNDLAVLNQLAARLTGTDQVHIADQVLTPVEVQALLGRADLVLGMRLHALILAANQGRAVVGLPYDPKVYNFLRQANAARFCAESYMPGADPLAGLLDLAWSEKNSFSSIWDAFLPRQRELTREDAKIALGLLDRDMPQPSHDLLQQFSLQKIRTVEGLDREIEHLKTRLKRKDRDIRSLHSQITIYKQKYEEYRRKYSEREMELEAIKNSRTWKLARVFQDARDWIVPSGSKREKMVCSMYEFIAGLFTANKGR